jgi:protein-disulfide isomerase
MAHTDTKKKGGGAARAGLWVGIAIVLVVVIVVAAKLAGPKRSSTATPGNGSDAPAITAADWSEGNANAKVSVIEYGDFQCPACGTYEPIMQQLVKNYGNRVQFVFREFPLTQIHDDAQLAAESAEAAGLQGKFWQMHDWLYANQLKWSVVPLTAQTIINDGAQSMSLDMGKFANDRKGSVVAKKIQTDVDGANNAGVDHTPTFFVNLKQIPNPAGYNAFAAVLDTALQGGTGTSTISSTTLNASTTGPSTKK